MLWTAAVSSVLPECLSDCRADRLWCAWQVVSFVVGFAFQSLKLTLGLFGLGVVGCLAVSAPTSTVRTF